MQFEGCVEGLRAQDSAIGFIREFSFEPLEFVDLGLGP